MKVTKKFLICILSLIISFSLYGCDDATTNNSSGTQSPKQEIIKKSSNIILTLNNAEDVTLTRSTGETQSLNHYDNFEENSPIINEVLETTGSNDGWDAIYPIEIPYQTSLKMKATTDVTSRIYFKEKDFGYILYSMLIENGEIEIEDSGKLSIINDNVLPIRYTGDPLEIWFTVMRGDAIKDGYYIDAYNGGAGFTVRYQPNEDKANITVERITNEKFVVNLGDQPVKNFYVEYDKKYYAESEKSSYTITYSKDFSSLTVE